eukprot:CAMPEP_0171085536 /NCGR_PEP_ID=MMETSP0766_2-20121228/18994_1 /TAXON_ID=439317 /ORGANISM="Gambierdiscus australes, Strain CAWD 149" /LENGTH=196 /DNA_ID=CAMNT_0011543113 /DNA_START=8 /DNA_END=598 /DNA_ORIENTATION=-
MPSWLSRPPTSPTAQSMTGGRFASERTLHHSPGLGGRYLHPVLSSALKPLRAMGEPLQSVFLRDTNRQRTEVTVQAPATAAAAHRSAQGTLLESRTRRKLAEPWPAVDAKVEQRRRPLEVERRKPFEVAPLSPTIKTRSMRSVDAETEVPEELFETLAKLGKEVRRGGQHVLVARAQGSARLVHHEVLRRIRSGSL